MILVDAMDDINIFVMNVCMIVSRWMINKRTMYAGGCNNKLDKKQKHGENFGFWQ